MDGIDENTLIVSPNNQRVAYVSKAYNKSYVVIDDEESDIFDFILKDTLIFSPDSTHFAFVAQKNNKLHVVLDGNVGDPYVETKHFEYSPDSQHVVYAAKRDNHWVLVYDGKEVDRYENIFSICFSPNGDHFAISGQKNGKYSLIIDGKCVNEYENIGFLEYSPDSKRLGYAVEQNGKYFIVIDGEKGPTLDSPLTATISIHPNTLDVVYDKPFLFSHDSSQIAYSARIRGYELAFRNHEIDIRCNGVIGGFTFSPDSKHLLYIAKIKDKQSIIIDGYPYRPYEYIVLGRNEVFSPNSARFAYVAKIGEKRCVVVDECEGMKVDNVKVQSVEFSPNSDTLLYRADLGQNIHLIHDGFIQKEFVNPYYAIFSPDSNHIVYDFQYGLKKGLVLDEKILFSCDGIIILGGGKIIFKSDSEVQFLANLQGAIYSINIIL